MTSNTYKDLSVILSEKQRVIDELKEEKNSLLRVISHDIKSPFNQLFALIQLFELEGEDLGERQKEYIDKMYHAVISGIEMIQNLQDFRSIDENSLQANIEKLDLGNVMKKVITRYQIQSRLNKVRLNLKQEPESIIIYSDEILILKILEKIISNAIKYSGTNSTVEIHLEQINGEVWVHVNDEGPGLGQEEIPFIYEPFRTLSAKPTVGGGTTGLGMFIAQKISEVLGISIRIKRNQKKGLEVSLKIPKS
jgi:signal transduction histidine kinase